MRARHYSFGRPAAAQAVALLLLAAAGAGAVTNTGRAALDFVDCNGRVGFPEPEAQQGATNLNGDSDALDAPLQILTLSSGAITNVGVDASGPLACGGNLFAFGVLEANQNDTDLNGDGDKFDYVLHVYDAVAATTTNLGLAVDRVKVDDAGGGLVAFTVPEASQGLGGTDLNGDGDKVDSVLHVYDPVSATVTNLGIAVSSDLVVRGRLAAARVSEAEQGNTDLNADGDTADYVLFVYDADNPPLLNTHMAADKNVQVDGRVVAFNVSEKSQAHISLNGDADAGDTVAHVYCAAGSSCAAGPGMHNLGVDARGGITLGGPLLALHTRERNQGNVDLNGDLDRSDLVIQIYHVDTGVLTNTHIAGRMTRIVGGKMIIGVPEKWQAGTDLNGDLDRSDVVTEIYDTATSTVTNTGRALPRVCLREPGGKFRGECFQASGDILALATNERAQNHNILNADGDLFDDVAEMWRLSDNTRVNSQFAIAHASAFAVGGTLGAFRVYEPDQRVVLNGDGDQNDRVMFVMNTATLTTTNLGYAAEAHFAVESGHVVWRTSETEQNVDLNGDGDKFDFVLLYQ